MGGDRGIGATIGITDHAQEQLGEIVYIELPVGWREGEQGRSIWRGRIGEGR